MTFFSPIPSLVAAALPLSPNGFMAMTVMTACVCGVIIVFNYLSLKNKSTHRLGIVSVVLLLAGVLVTDAAIGLTFQGDSSDLLANPAGKTALGLLVLAACAGLGGFLHAWWHRHRYRRGKKRALGSFVFALLAIGALFGLSHASKHARAPSGPRTTVELLPETDSYGRPLATPAPATPAPATPALESLPFATPIPLVAPTQIATPTPKRLLPSVITQ